MFLMNCSSKKQIVQQHPPHATSGCHSAWRFSDLPCDPHNSLVTWVGVQGSRPSFRSWENGGSEMGLPKYYRCLIFSR